MNPHQRNIVKLIEQSRYQYDVHDVFSDAMATMALAISNSVDLSQRDKREKRYLDIVGRYDKKTVDTFPKIMAETAMALETETVDVLGQVFNELELHNRGHGQVFTPPSVCQLLSEMNIDDRLKETVERKGFVTLHEPAVGAGAMVIAFADSMRNRGLNPQQQLHVTAIDIDSRAAHMAYVQFSMLGIPATVTVGNTLTMEMRETFYSPMHVLGDWDTRLRIQRDFERIQELTTETKVEEPPVAEAAAIAEVRQRFEKAQRQSQQYDQAPLFELGL